MAAVEMTNSGEATLSKVLARVTEGGHVTEKVSFCGGTGKGCVFLKVDNVHCIVMSLLWRRVYSQQK